jgi:hypothetical protein
MQGGPEAVREPPPPPAQAHFHPPPYAYPIAPPEDLRRLAKNGWLCVIVGVLIPPLELLAVAVAIRLITRERLGHGIPMVVLAVLIFGVRAALYLG